jgi:hypothetical protein
VQNFITRVIRSWSAGAADVGDWRETAACSMDAARETLERACKMNRLRACKSLAGRVGSKIGFAFQSID